MRRSTRLYCRRVAILVAKIAAVIAIVFALWLADIASHWGCHVKWGCW